MEVSSQVSATDFQFITADFVAVFFFFVLNPHCGFQIGGRKKLCCSCELQGGYLLKTVGWRSPLVFTQFQMQDLREKHAV